ncbi:ABC transporter ATP-binding protein [Ornithinimicrobium sediminis]|uniref:ABC transporter ATP-binding protein n=1 Tax=Ornithinimicrobium sediminis TaxID=2904603 RepID=UPI001E576DC4|nr:ABC transporter ATP-binding protein [Ornithinimicrobium sediminis]MCE0487628.1 ABC transporter ATP-binding protein/permease [Ornithinimicrobium sediminis]
MTMRGMGHGGGPAYRQFSKDRSVTEHTLREDTARRVWGYGRPFRRDIGIFLALTVLGAGLVAATPLLLGRIIDRGVIPGDRDVVVSLGVVVALVAVVEALLMVVTRWFSSRIGEGLILDLRSQVFGHVLRQPIAFFTRAQTGALVNRLNTDVIGAQQAFTSILSGVVSNVVSLVILLIALLSMSWQITVLALVLLPVFLVPASFMGRRLSTLTRTQMNLNSELASRMTERFNVAGALLVRLFGDPRTESREYDHRARGVRDTGVAISVNRVVFTAGLGLVAALATAIVYGVGGLMAVEGSLSVGTLVAMAALLARIYGPLTALSNVRVDVMTALVSFERIFEILDLRPLVTEAEEPVDLPEGPVGVTFEGVDFAYPAADEVSIASLELRPGVERVDGRPVLSGLDIDIPAGRMVALVGPSGAGKSTLTSLVSRLYDPSAGTVRIGGVDLRETSFSSLRRTVGVVTQEAHMFNDTIRANLAYAAPGADEDQMREALRGARIWDLVANLPDGLDTVVGDRGHRLSGGEKQRLAIARLLLKSPSVVVLDEATAHLDSESEVAVQRALDEALAGRTSLVIAHRLSTVRDADLILVLAGGRVVQQGSHEELLAEGGLYRVLYETQFATDTTTHDPLHR